MELCPALGMTGDYFTMAMQGSKFRFFPNIILGIHEDDIPSYNASRRALIEKRETIKNYREQEEADKSAKLVGD